MRPALQAILFGPPGWVRALSPGSIPSLALDFANQRYWTGQNLGAVDAVPGWSFSRTGTEYEANSSGSLVSFGSGVPAITDLGLQVWEARTNLLLWSQDFSNAAWATSTYGTGTGNVPTATASAGTAPDGTNTASLISIGARSASTRGQTMAQNLTGTAATYTGAVWVKAQTAGDVGKQINQYVWNGSTFAATKTITLTAAWQRTTLSGALTATASNQPLAFGRLAQTDGGISDLTAVGFFAWQGQGELASFAGPDILTTSASATRGAASASVGGLSLPSALTIVAEFDTSAPGTNRRIFTFDDGTENNRIDLAINTTDQANLAVVSGGVSQASLDTGTVSANTTTRIAGRFAASNFGVSVGGGAVLTSASGSLPTGITNAKIGYAVTASRLLNGRVRRVIVYPFAFSDAQLIAAST